MALRARRGIPHLGPIITPKGNKAPTLNEQEFDSLWQDGVMKITNATEKTDGIAWLIGYDAEGFFTMHSGSGGEKARKPNDHVIRAESRGVVNTAPYKAMAFVHHALSYNNKLQSYLDNRYNGIDDVIIRGEAFIHDLAVIDEDKGTITFNRIPYDYQKLGYQGATFIIHTELEDNKGADLDLLIGCSNPFVIFDHDRYDFIPLMVHEVPSWLNIEFDFKKTITAQTIESYFNQKVPPKWGPVREGIVIHPTTDDQPRFKIISEDFRNAQGKWY